MGEGEYVENQVSSYFQRFKHLDWNGSGNNCLYLSTFWGYYFTGYFRCLCNIIVFISRVLLKKPNHDDEIPGKPKEAEKLFVPPRSRRRSSAILNCSAAAVVKAVLLLRKDSDNDTDTSFSFPFPKKPSSALTRDYQRRKHQEKSPTVVRRPKSVRSHLVKETSSTRGSHSKVSVFGRGKEALTQANVKSQNKMGASVKDNYKNKQANKDTSKKKFKATCKVSPAAENTKEATMKVKSRTNSPSFLPSVATERNIAQKPNVVIKEIINTGIPGRRFSPKSFRRFERSLFDVLDNPPNYEHSSSDEESSSATKSPILNPWNISLAASKWVSTVRQAQRTKNSHSPEAILDDTGQPPIIVIEDWAPGAALGEPESAEAANAQLSPSKKAPLRKTSRSTTPILDDVTEESEEEIQKYEHELVPSQRYKVILYHTQFQWAKIIHTSFFS